MDLLRFWRIFWVDATSAETIQLSLQDIAADPDARASGVKGSVESVLGWLSRVEGEWLIVFDNVDGDPYVVAQYFPGGNQGNILFTSRNQGLRRYVSHEASAEVEKMEDGDAVSLLLKSALLDGPSMEMKSAAGQIVQELCFLPLAVDQAGAAIANGLCNIDDYLEMYSEHRHELLADHTFQGASKYGRAVYGTWDLSFEAIKARHDDASKSAILILQIFAFFHHENIMEEIFKRAAEASDDLASEGVRDFNVHFVQDHGFTAALSQLLQLDKRGKWDSFGFREGIRILMSFSLIKKGTVSIGNAYSLHPLVHCWSHDIMSPQERQIKSYASHLLSSSTSSCSEDYSFSRMLLPHIKAIDEHYTAMEIQKSTNDKQYTKFGWAFYDSGFWMDAEKFFFRVMEMRKRVLGEEHPHTLTAMGNLAYTYRQQGHWKEAEELEVQVMDRRKRILGGEHPDTLRAMGNLASTYRNQ